MAIFVRDVRTGKVICRNLIISWTLQSLQLYLTQRQNYRWYVYIVVGTSDNSP